MTDSPEKQLITVERTSALEIFTTNTKLETLIDDVKRQVISVVPDVETVEGRKNIASVAYTVARTKVYLDNIGKELVAEYKELPKLIDAGRKYAREELDKLRDSVRAPLDEWEAEQARAAEAIRLRDELLRCHTEALELNELYTLRKEQEAAKIAQERKEFEEKTKREAEERAKFEAERAVAEKIRAAEKEAENSRQRALQAESEAKHALETQKREAEEARIKAQHAADTAIIEARREAEAQAAAAIEQARRKEYETRRQQEHEAARIALEKQKEEHRTAVEDALFESLSALGFMYEPLLTKMQIKVLITEIKQGVVPILTINY
jgi:DNA repair exonuclease SbcCD ATPase subunit